VYIPRIEPAVDPPPPQLAYAFPNQYWHLPKNYEDLVGSIRWAARNRLSAEVNAPPWVTTELARQDSGPLLLHLVNYKPKESVHDIRVMIRTPAKSSVKKAVLVTPEDVAGQTLPFQASQGEVSIVVPSMRVYALITMSLVEDK
jgi:hypothetical protein